MTPCIRKFVPSSASTRRFVLAAALPATFAMSACGVPASAAAGGGTPAEPHLEADRVVMAATSPYLQSITTAVVGQPTATKLSRLNGRLTWDEDRTVRIFTPVTGRVSRILVSTGERVSSGQSLALIASSDFGQAQADVSRATADLTLATRSLVRLRDLLTHGIVAAKEVEASEADSLGAAAERQRASARLSLLGGDSTTVIQGFALKAPLGGLVVERSITPGQEVRPDQMLASAPSLMAPLFVITDPTRLWVDLDVPERDLAGLVVGQPMALRLLARPDRPVRGRITLIGSSVDPATRTVKIRGAVDNPRLDLKAEMLVSAEVSVTGQLAVGIPAKAVFLEGDRHVVFVEERTGVFRHAEVAAGPERIGLVSVAAGVRPGDRVVVDGSLLLNQLFHALRTVAVSPPGKPGA